MGSTLLLGDGPERIAAAEEWLAARRGPVLVLSPSRGAADDLVRKAALRSGGFLGVQRFSLIGFATIVAAARMADGELTPLGSVGIDALVARSLHGVEARHEGLAYFGPVADMPGFPVALSRTLRELRENLVAPASLPRVPAGLDLASILEEFERLLRGRSLADSASILDLATRAVAEGNWIEQDPDLLLLDVAPHSVREEKLLAKIISRCRETLATCLSRRPREIESLSRLLGKPRSVDPANENRLTAVRAAIFEGGSGSEAGRSDDCTFEFLTAPGEHRECVEVVRRIIRRASEGVPYDQMAILLRNRYLYLPNLEDALARGGIPVYFTRGAIRPNPAGRAFLALLECAVEELSAARFAEYLSLAQVPKVPESKEPRQAPSVPWVAPAQSGQMSFKTVPEEPSEVGPSLESEEEAGPGTLRTPAHWEKLLVEAAVVGGADRWRRRLAGLERELEIKRQLLPEDDAAADLLKDRLVRLRSLSEFALPLIEQLSGLPSEASWGEWLDRLRVLATAALRSPEAVLELLAELEPMEEVGPVTLPEVREVLASHLLFLTQESPGDRYGRLFVGTLEEAAGRSFDTVFIPGLAEGILPRRVFEDPLLLDGLRESAGLPLSTRWDRILDERYLLRLGLAAARERVVVSFPRVDLLQGRARVPSLYALELLRAAEGEIPDLGDLERPSPDEPKLRLGWPAPADPLAAIDEIEYDLACLEPLLHGTGVEDRKGGGRFLLELNPWLSRSIRFRYKRWESRWSDEDGLVAARDRRVRAELAKHRMTSRSYSPTSLQHYAVCPYRFFLHALQRLQPREGIESIERMDPLIRGSLFHEVQSQLFGRLDEQGIVRVNQENLADLLDQLDSILDQVASNYFDQLAPALERVWREEVEEIRVDLRCWMRELAEEDSDWVPYRWEYSFGLPADPQRDPRSCDQEAVLRGGYRLRGAIDLVERDAGRKILRVVDHKTGRAPQGRPRFVGGGELLQPLLYGLAAETLLGETVEEGQLYYCTQLGGFQRLDFPLEPGSRKVIEWCLDTIEEAIETAFLPAAPREDGCKYCDYHSICGPYEELRVKRKPRQNIGRLLELRELQ